MTIMTDDAFVREVQRRLAAAGYYTGQADGVAGNGTQAALDKALPPLVVISVMPSDEDKIPASGNAKLVGVHPKLAAVVQKASLASPVPFTVIEGVRTKERQAQLVKAGASKTSNSRHLTGHAVDLWPLDANGQALSSGSPEKEAALWANLRKIAATMKDVAKAEGVLLEWGGDWGWDAPHFQLNRSAYPA